MTQNLIPPSAQELLKMAQYFVQLQPEPRCTVGRFARPDYVQRPNMIERNRRHAAWRKAEVIYQYEDLRRDFVDTTKYMLRDAAGYEPRISVTFEEYKAAVLALLLTPAPTVLDLMKKKRVSKWWLEHGPLKEQKREVEEAFAADEQWLATNPYRSGRKGGRKRKAAAEANATAVANEDLAVENAIVPAGNSGDPALPESPTIAVVTRPRSPWAIVPAEAAE